MNRNWSLLFPGIFLVYIWWIGWNMLSGVLSFSASSTLLASIFSKSRQGLEILNFFFKLPRQILFLFLLVSLSLWSLAKPGGGRAESISALSAFSSKFVSSVSVLQELSSRSSSSLELDKSSPPSSSLNTAFNVPLSTSYPFSSFEGFAAWFRFILGLLLLPNFTMRTSLTTGGDSLSLRCSKLRLTPSVLLAWLVRFSDLPFAGGLWQMSHALWWDASLTSLALLFVASCEPRLSAL